MATLSIYIITRLLLLNNDVRKHHAIGKIQISKYILVVLNMHFFNDIRKTQFTDNKIKNVIPSYNLKFNNNSIHIHIYATSDHNNNYVSPISLKYIAHNNI